LRKISAKEEYACLAALALARRHGRDEPIPLREIAAEDGIPERYLVQILLQLKGAGLVQSVRGSTGGYRLARPPHRLTLGEVIRAIGGSASPLPQPLGPGGRALAQVWRAIEQAEWSILDQTTLAQLVPPEDSSDWVI
jgi:Rrf2 family protein